MGSTFSIKNCSLPIITDHQKILTMSFLTISFIFSFVVYNGVSGLHCRQSTTSGTLEDCADSSTTCKWTKASAVAEWTAGSGKAENCVSGKEAGLCEYQGGTQYNYPFTTYCKPASGNEAQGCVPKANDCKKPATKAPVTSDTGTGNSAARASSTITLTTAAAVLL